MYFEDVRDSLNNTTPFPSSSHSESPDFNTYYYRPQNQTSQSPPPSSPDGQLTRKVTVIAPTNRPTPITNDMHVLFDPTKQNHRLINAHRPLMVMAEEEATPEDKCAFIKLNDPTTHFFYVDKLFQGKCIVCDTPLLDIVIERKDDTNPQSTNKKCPNKNCSVFYLQTVSFEFDIGKYKVKTRNEVEKIIQKKDIQKIMISYCPACMCLSQSGRDGLDRPMKVCGGCNLKFVFVKEGDLYLWKMID